MNILDACLIAFAIAMGLIATLLLGALAIFFLPIHNEKTEEPDKNHEADRKAEDNNPADRR